MCVVKTTFMVQSKNIQKSEILRWLEGDCGSNAKLKYLREYLYTIRFVSGVLGSFFDVVDDAFSGRSPSLPSETDSVLDSRSESVLEGSSSASNMSESESRSTSAASVSPPESE